MGLNDEFLDRAVRHAAYLERVKLGEVKRIVKLLEREVTSDLLGTLIARLQNIATRGYDTGPATTLRIAQLLKAVNAQIDKGISVIHADARETLLNFAKHEAAYQVAAWSAAIPLVIDYTIPNVTLLRSIVTSRPFQGRLLNGWFNDLSRATREAVQKQLSIGLTTGETVPQIMRRFRGESGVAGMTRRHVEAVTRTSINHVVTQAREITYEENADIIEAVQWVSTLDSRTTPLCQSLDGQTFAIGEGPRPPAHMGCRSTTIPIIKDFARLPGGKKLPPAQRASIDGAVPAKTTYPEWLARQSNDTQGRVLGKRRAELFRAGKYKIDRHVVNGRPLTLVELAKMESE